MFKNKQRAIRRHHARRIKQKCRQQNYHDLRNWTHSDEHLRKVVGITAATQCLCSCAACGNPRRSVLNSGSERLTLAERKAMITRQEMLADISD